MRRITFQLTGKFKIKQSFHFSFVYLDMSIKVKINESFPILQDIQLHIDIHNNEMIIFTRLMSYLNS